MHQTRAVACLTFALLSSVAMAQEWSFTDGAGNTITLDSPPERIVAFSSSAAGLLQFGIRPIGIFADGTGSDRSFAGLDIEGIEIIETAWNELQPEALLALDPDIIVTEYFSHSQTYSGGEQMRPDGEFGRVAPIVGVEQGDSALRVIEDYGVLAEALGADLDAPDIAAQRASFDRARAAFIAAVEAKPGLTLMAINPGPEVIRVAVPAGAGELQDFIAWGLDVVVPDAEQGDYWGLVSWENAGIHPADVLIVDDRYDYEGGLRILEDQPLARLIPAVAAGQIGEWPAWWIRTYASYAAELGKLTALIERSDVVSP